MCFLEERERKREYWNKGRNEEDRKREHEENFMSSVSQLMLIKYLVFSIKTHLWNIFMCYSFRIDQTFDDC